ncbi:MAG: tRNA 5-methoxyuridine(34)/uridine 5-oxyacetic acid(34) synthase CmoB [Pseudomonadales bacterium]
MSHVHVPAVPRGFEPCASLLDERLAAGGHGDMVRWQAALSPLPALRATRVDLGATITAEGTASATERRRLEAALAQLHPWRKGPFHLFGVTIDAEWRSDWKWARVLPHLASLEGHRVLDVGCGNGYFGWRMLEAGAREVVGVDPTLVFCMQHRAIAGYLDARANHVLPLRFEEVPPGLRFDSVFSMGVIYHRRDPAEHAKRLFRHTRPGGQVVLESLVVEGAEPLRPRGRYARMRNVWLVPDPATLCGWLERAGFCDVRTVDVGATRVDEQRATAWMRFESLAAALDPDRPGRTVEGHPAPLRAVVVGRKRVYSRDGDADRGAREAT